MLLRQCGITPAFLLPPELDEDAAVAEFVREMAPNDITPVEYVSFLAERKAQAACAQLPPEHQDFSGLLLAGDSMFELDGEILGKPGTAERARERWLAMRGKTGTLFSASAVVLLANGEVVDSRVGDASATVSFSPNISDAEIDDYVASKEPLQVAGAFTLDGLAAPFIDQIVGSPSTVIGMSLPLLRQQFAELGASFADLAAGV